MSVKFSIIRDTCAVAAGNVDYISPDLGGSTPVAAWFEWSRAVTDGSPANHLVLGVGAATGVGNRWACCKAAEHNVTPTDNYRRGIIDGCILVLDPTTGAVDGEADFVGFVAGGVRVNWTNACASPYLLKILLIADFTDVSAHAAVFEAAAAQDAFVDVNTVGFEPDILLTASMFREFVDYSYNYANLSVGAVTNTSPINQVCWGSYHNYNVAASAVASRITGSYGIGNCNWNGTWVWAGEFGDFDANGFTCWTRLGNNTSNDDVGFLALAFNGQATPNAGIIQTPTAVGNQSQAGIGFTPYWVGCGLTQMPLIDTAYVDSNAGSLGLSDFDGNNEYCISAQEEDAANPTDTQSLCDNRAVDFPDDDGTAAHAADFVSFHGDGWTWDFTATEGTEVQWWYAAVGIWTPPPPPPTPPTEVYVPPVLPPTFVQAKGLSIVYSDPITKTPRAGFLGEMREKISAYQQVVSAWGGYDMATIRMAATQNDADEWLEYGLCRHVEVYSPSLELIWEGMVDQVAVSLGKASITVGPILDSANRVATVYSTVDTTVSPPVFGIRTKTAVANDADAQARFGIIEKIYSVGGATQTDAEQIRDTYLKENAWPPTTQVLGETGNETSIILTCLGYVHWFKCYVYNYTTNTGTENLSAKIQSVIASQLNSIIRSYDIVTNTLAVDRYENDDKTAWDLLKGLTAMGDANDARYLFGVYKQRKAVYEAAPTTHITYQQRLADPSQRVELLTGSEVKPWDVLPGKWLFVPDFLVGKSQPLVLRKDPRYIFIEKVTFTMPYGLNIQGGKVDTLPQKLARMGLGGVSA